MKTNPEWADNFDILYNSITSNQCPGLDNVEKSFFLNKAQDELIKSYFSPKLNKPQEGFDDSERRQIDFSNIIAIQEVNSKEFEEAEIDDRGNVKTANLNDDILIILNEYVIVNRKATQTRLTVVPIDYREYQRLMSKPNKRPLKNQAWRLFGTSNKAELIPGYGDLLYKYVVRYIRKPRQIDLDSETQTCELDESCHHELLQRAAELAKAVYTGDLSTQVSLGTASQTEIGIIPQSR